MKKLLLVLLSVISIATFSNNQAEAAQIKELRKGNGQWQLQTSANGSEQKLLTHNFLIATTVKSAMKSATVTSKVTVIAGV